MEHYAVPCMIVGDYPYEQCVCGEVFQNHTKLNEHFEQKGVDPAYTAIALIEGPYRQTRDKLLEIVKRVDEILDEKNLHHGPTCKTVWDISYYECKCGLKPLHKLQLEHVKPLLKELEKE